MDSNGEKNKEILPFHQSQMSGIWFSNCFSSCVWVVFHVTYLPFVFVFLLRNINFISDPLDWFPTCFTLIFQRTTLKEENNAFPKTEEIHFFHYSQMSGIWLSNYVWVVSYVTQNFKTCLPFIISRSGMPIKEGGGPLNNLLSSGDTSTRQSIPSHINLI